MSDPPTILFDIAEDLIQECVDLLNDISLDPPDRTFVDIGTVTAPVTFGDDCVDQLTVIGMPVNPSLVTDLTQRREGKAQCHVMWQVDYQITYLRCAEMWSGDEGDPLPTTTQINSQALILYQYAWQLLRGLAYLWTKGHLVPSFTFDCENFQWGRPALSVRPPQGGLMGFDIKFNVSVYDQYQPSFILGS